jgi:hypothetical protein
MQSIVSYPDRGPWGQSSWRGNTSGHLLVDLFGHFRPGHVVDPAEGSGTTRDVCRDMRISYEGFDLHSGFNLLTDSLAQACSTTPDMVFFHPPYGDMITYSGNVWGEPTEGDLSRCRDAAEFVDKLQLALINIYDALNRDGHYAVLIGDHRKNGEFRSYQADVIAMGIGSLQNVVIKAQHNCVSDRRSYTGRFIPIRHEYLLVFRKDTGLFAIGPAASERLSKAFYGTWRNLVEFALRKLGGKASLSALYEFVGVPDGHSNQHVQAKVRQVLQRHFSRVERGVYALAA